MCVLYTCAIPILMLLLLSSPLSFDVVAASAGHTKRFSSFDHISDFFAISNGFAAFFRPSPAFSAYENVFKG